MWRQPAVVGAQSASSRICVAAEHSSLARRRCKNLEYSFRELSPVPQTTAAYLYRSSATTRRNDIITIPCATGLPVSAVPVQSWATGALLMFALDTCQFDPMNLLFSTMTNCLPALTLPLQSLAQAWYSYQGSALGFMSCVSVNTAARLEGSRVTLGTNFDGPSKSILTMMSAILR